MTDLKTQVADALAVSMTAADLAESKLKDLQERVKKGESILAEMKLTDPRRVKTVALLELRKRELAEARVQAERFGAAFRAQIETGVAAVERVPDQAPSLNCVVCGKKCEGQTKPGFYVLIACAT